MDRTSCDLNGKYDKRDMSTTQCDFNPNACNHINIFKNQQEGRKIYNTIHSHFIACTTPAYRRLKIVNTRCHQCGGRRRLHSCLHCVYFGCYNGHLQDHHEMNDHYLYADLTYGNILCMKCGDYEYDDELAEIAHKNVLETSRSLGYPVAPYVNIWLTKNDISEIVRQSKRLNLASQFPVGLRPLVNLGNTCFINSIIQVLVRTPILRIYLLSGRHKCPNPENLCLMCAVAEIFQAYYCGGQGIMALDRFLHLMYHYAPQFADGTQQDVQEFFLQTLYILHKNCVMSQRFANEDQTLQGEWKTKLEDDHASKNQSLIKQVFMGIDQSDIKCLSCHNVSSTKSPFWDIQLDLGPLAHGSLLDCLHRYTLLEQLDEQIDCIKCNLKCKATKQLKLKKIPIVLTFHLKRFKKGNAKLPTKILFPEVLDMADFMTSPTTETPNGTQPVTNGTVNGTSCNNFNSKLFSPFDTRYILFGVVEHKGNCYGGHYQAFVRLQHDLWYKCNDYMITRVALKEVLDSQGYLLFYHKRTVEYI